jgi:hypothetical protein
MHADTAYYANSTSVLAQVHTHVCIHADTAHHANSTVVTHTAYIVHEVSSSSGVVLELLNNSLLALVMYCNTGCMNANSSVHYITCEHSGHM